MQDIDQHFETLKNYAEKSEVIVEFGVREADKTGSTMAFLAGKPRMLWSYDIDGRDYSHVYKEAEKQGVQWYFIKGDSAKVDIPFCDFLFIDSEHTGEHVTKEIIKHIHKVRKWIGFHDTHTHYFPGFGETIFALMKQYPFEIELDHPHCNGLTIFRRIQ